MTNPQLYLENQKSLTPEARLEGLVNVLRGPDGCPWDQKQTAQSMVEYLIDEAHELKEALLSTPDKAREELGDLLFTLKFVQIAMGESGATAPAVDALVEKMIRRHPHVFARESFEGDSDIKANWEREKRREQPGRERLDDDLPASLPPLKRATKVLGRARNAGFRYPTPEAALDKVEEEYQEFTDALAEQDAAGAEEEFGDLLLALLTLAGERGLKPELALRRAQTKFCDRIQTLETEAGKPMADLTHERMAAGWRRVRAADEPAYFNYSGVSVWPRQVRTAVRVAAQNIGRRGLDAVLELRERRDQLRALIGRLVQAPPESVVFSPNISSSALGVAFAQTWREGDVVMIGEGEFPANTVPWALAAECFKARLVRFPDDLLRTEPELGWRRLESLLKEHRPRLLAISAVSFWSGFKVDLARLAHLCLKYECRLFVDGIQALGTTPVTLLEGVDYLAGGSHKGLLAPEAAGFLVVSERAARDWQPRLGSWLSLPDPVHFLMSGHKDQLPEQLEPRSNDPSTLEGGSVNTLGYAGLAASLELLLEVGIESVHRHVQDLHDKLEPGLQELGFTSLRSCSPDGRSAILSVEPPPQLELLRVQQHLRENGVMTGTPNGRLRFGCHYFNSDTDVTKALSVVAALLR